MYTSEGAPDFVVDQGMYYPVDASYGYYCTGYESPGDWENHQMFFGVDGSEVQYTGGQNENSPYICYTPSYGYAQSPYNPFNPYIPGASIGVDSPFVGPQQFYSFPPYQSVATSPTFVPYAIQPDIISTSSTNSLVETGSANRGRSDGRGSRHRNDTSSGGVQRNAPKLSAVNSLGKTPDKPRPNSGQSRQGEMEKSESTPSSGQALQGRATSVSVQPVDVVSSSSRVSSFGQLDTAPPGLNGFPKIATNNTNLRPKMYGGYANIIPDRVSEQNRGRRSRGLGNQLIVKAYTTKAGNADAEGNIVINPSLYNKEDLRIDYSNAKFFVIKSYSEDDVHKSIKYNVWSSTLHGNKKLQSAYEDAQKIASEKSCECPIFLFFSVNASGLFCGMAEMTGPVSFDKDMDFWQQDKWSGSFPVKWHIIKDVPNSYFRHIILQNNENKPVTNSRDTQEIMLKQGLEVVKIFKDHMERTSLLDDFVYYESRQRVMLDERTRLPYRTFISPSPLPRPDLSDRNKKTSLGAFKKPSVISEESEEVRAKSDGSEETTVKEGNEEDTSPTQKKMSSLTIDPSVTESNPTTVSHLNQKGQAKSKPTSSGSQKKIDPSEVVDASLSDDSVKQRSVPIKVADESPAILTVGTIPLDTKSLQK
ncbi:PREDICTED: YTH domain-containing family protein 2 [Camelina sativa]|uniref:YTH domain-containing family protein n=1 Tax=Camelina sativa TaxID=90675 RepID=A0ABM0YFY1_CAMSA|nr:PREDICTED: YTH domain-containing family protein 2 [Camelina sativa]